MPPGSGPPTPHPPPPSRLRRAKNWFAALSETGKVSVVVALIGSLLGGIFGIINVVIPLIINNGSGDNPGAAPTAQASRPTTLPTTTAPISDPPSDGTPGETPRAGTSTEPSTAPPGAVGDMNFTGDTWSRGTWLLGGSTYPHSLGLKTPCHSREKVVIPLPGTYERFTATVGMDDDTLQDISYIDEPQFDIYADRNADGLGDKKELIASRTVEPDKPATINAPLNGAKQLLLQIDTQKCYTTTLVWGNPQVR
ncbi:NPCBM/NEW2 domain-containing protein [Streptomyces sp. NPDC053560]|uniref:NPCBM/NEW2 domain-containing protein n=1 Tax=Streptomyces sp. NPDC053560 TaxID=3365711 RepID=UPI0037D30414